MAEESFGVDKPLPIGASGTKSSGWWGVCMLIVTEASLFGYLLMSYYYLWSQTLQKWPPEGLPDLKLPGLNTAILLSSSVFVWLAEHFIKKSAKNKSALGLCGAIILGAIFIAIQCKEWMDKDYGLQTHIYGSLYFTITGFHMLHVAVGLIMLGILAFWTFRGFYDARRYEAIRIGGLYWHFVDAVWILIFSTFFILPYLR